MPAIFGASVSSNRVPYFDLWAGCISHQLNTAMKYAFENVEDKTFRKYMNHPKKLVRIFKKSGLNEKLPPGKDLKLQVLARSTDALWFHI